jgi:hypothetical protein
MTLQEAIDQGYQPFPPLRKLVVGDSIMFKKPTGEFTHVTLQDDAELAKLNEICPMWAEGHENA